MSDEIISPEFAEMLLDMIDEYAEEYSAYGRTGWSVKEKHRQIDSLIQGLVK